MVANPKQMASTNVGPKRSSIPAPAHGQTSSSRVDALSRVRQPSQSNVINSYGINCIRWFWIIHHYCVMLQPLSIGTCMLQKS